MRVSERWLREWLPGLVGGPEWIARLDELGLEVDGVEPAAPPFHGVVVAEVLAVAPHPNADKLRVCRVSDGRDEWEVVCGAPNVAAGIKVPFAREGAELPGGLRIRKARLRGVESRGMLCSAAELGLAERADGLMVLPADAPPGVDLREYLDLDDRLLDIAVTPNRGDCLSIAGLARELAAALGLALRAPETAPVAVSLDETPLDVDLADPACGRYCGRVIRGVDPRARTPLWMAEKLRRAGLRSIHPVVDVTNYVMLELGQPMHAFDLQRLSRNITVRWARAGESLRLLNEQTVELDPDCLVIADGRGPVALAGVMGGLDSAVTAGSRDLFLESAFFEPEAIAGRARRFGLASESAYRFERGVDPGLQRRALERATALILEICGGRAGPPIERRHPASPRGDDIAIHLRRDRVEALLGCRLADADISGRLAALGCGLEARDDGWRVVVPSHRFDLRIEADLIEEIARLHGYARLPRRLPAFAPAPPSAPEGRLDAARLALALVERGYREIISYSFIEPELAARLAPGVEPVALRNPLSRELSVMRPSLWPGLLGALRHNRHRQQADLALFEIGTCFLPAAREGRPAEEIGRIGGLRCGRRLGEGWNRPREAVDFFDIKGDVERLLVLGGEEAVFEAAVHPVLHPGQSARVVRAGRVLGWLGALHPALLAALDLDGPVFVFELDLEPLCAAAVPQAAAPSRFPAVRRDLAVLVPRDCSWAQVEAVLRRAAPPIVQSWRLFDVYTGPGVGPERKSFAIGLILQDISRTLTDRDVESAGAAVLAALAEELGATLRE